MRTEFDLRLSNSLLGRRFTLAVKIGLVIFVLAGIIFTTLPAFAVVADPDSAPTISNVFANTHLYASGDWLIYGEYNIPYAVLPTPSVTATYIFRLMSADGSTEVGRIIPYPEFDKGYNVGDFSMYLASGIVKDTAYIIQITQNPAQFASPKTWSFPMDSSMYSGFTDYSSNAFEAGTKILALADHVGSLFSTPLITTVGSQQVFNSDGETYYRGVIPGIQTMLPNLFVIQQSALDLTARTWTTTQFDNYLERFDGTWVGDEQDATGAQFGMSGNMVMSMIVIAPMCIGLMIFSAMKFGKTDPGLMSCAIILQMGVVMGWLPAALFATIYQLMGIYIAYLLFFARS